MAEKKSVDFLGIAPYGEAFNTAVTKSFDGVSTFLCSVCMPAFEEIGLMLKDQVRRWRLCNILRIIEKAKDKLEFTGDQLQIKAHPRVVLSIIENGSLNDNDEVQELWAGLFASSCTNTDQVDENLIFVNLLKQLTIAEAKLLKFACENSKKVLNPNGLVTSTFLEVEYEKINQILGINDIHRLDRELDHLRSMELIGYGSGGGFFATEKKLIADITPTSLALNLYLKCQGSIKSMDVFWENSIIPYEQFIKENQ